MMRMPLFLVLALVAFAVASDPIPLREPTDADVKMMKSRGEVVTLADMQKGKLLLLTTCVKCHKAYDAREGAKKRWPRVLKSMAKMSKLDSMDTWRIQVYMASQQAAQQK